MIKVRRSFAGFQIESIFETPKYWSAVVCELVLDPSLTSVQLDGVLESSPKAPCLSTTMASHLVRSLALSLVECGLTSRLPIGKHLRDRTRSRQLFILLQSSFVSSAKVAITDN